MSLNTSLNREIMEAYTAGDIDRQCKIADRLRRPRTQAPRKATATYTNHAVATSTPIEPDDFSKVLPSDAPDKFADHCFVKTLSLNAAIDLWAKNSEKWAEAERYAMGPPNFERGIAAEKTIHDRFEFLCRLGKAPKPAPVQPEQDAPATDHIATWRALVEAKVATGSPRDIARQEVARENPQARTAYVAAFNALHRGKRK